MGLCSQHPQKGDLHPQNAEFQERGTKSTVPTQKRKKQNAQNPKRGDNCVHSTQRAENYVHSIQRLGIDSMVP